MVHWSLAGFLVGLILLAFVLFGCATSKPTVDLETWGAPLTRHEAAVRHAAPPVFGCVPTHTNPDGIPDGGCI